MSKVKASDISDRAVLSAIRVIQRERDAGRWQGMVGGRVSIWDIQSYLNAWPRKVVRAKLRSMIKRGLIDGCVHYGTDCRGDFIVVEDRDFAAYMADPRPKKG